MLRSTATVMVALAIGTGLLALPCRAAVSNFHVISLEPLAIGSATRFGASATAEKITATATIALDPTDRRNEVIVDLDKAPVNAQGQVEAVADVLILQPATPNGALLVELPNRGASQLYGILNDLDTASGQKLATAGNGFLLARGYTLVLVGWQGDITPGEGMGIRLPAAHGMTGISRDQWILRGAESSQRLSLSWPIADPAGALLRIRPNPDAAAVVPAGVSFHFPNDRHMEITRATGAASAGTYELIYRAKDPAIMGMGFAAVRDVTTFLRHETSALNPLAHDGRVSVRRALASGVSQTGRALRDLLYFGFNEDESGRKVFDGMLPVIPGTRRSFTNARFAQPGRNPGPEADQLYPVDQFPFTYEVSTDSLSGRRDGLLRRCRLSNTCPRIMEFDSEYEFWGSRASLLVTDTRGKALALPAEVRAYMLAGAPHSNPWNAVSAKDPRCVLPSSPVVAGPAIRALLTALNAWTTNGAAPPASRYPSLTNGTLVAAENVYAPDLPLPYHGQHVQAQWVEQTDAGPVIKGEYPVLFPKAGPDGNAIAGIHLPIVAVPRATYVGWNPQAGKSGPQDLCDHAAGMVPFAKTQAERIAEGDPRPSLEELYPTRAAYVSAVRAAATKLVGERLLLTEDADVAIKAADTDE